MRKGNKANYIETLKEILGNKRHETTVFQQTSDETELVIDMMAFVQKYQDLGSKNFDTLQRKYLQKIISMRPSGCDHIHIIGDKYIPPNISLKYEERCRREKSTAKIMVRIPHAAIPVSKWKKITLTERKTNTIY